VQLCAAADKVRVWIELESVAEHFTVVPTFVSIYYNRNWLGLYISRLCSLSVCFKASMSIVILVCTAVRRLSLRTSLPVDKFYLPHLHLASLPRHILNI